MDGVVSVVSMSHMTYGTVVVGRYNGAMTETKTITLDPGCYIDGWHGQYVAPRLAELTDELLGTDYVAKWPRDPEDDSLLGLYGTTGSPWHSDTADEMIALMDEMEEKLNDALPDDRFVEWVDGDMFVTLVEDAD
jgi:hypothetical protein